MKVHVITCTHCGKAVTLAFSWPEENGPFVLRAFVECPECVEAQPDLPQAELARKVADAAAEYIAVKTRYEMAAVFSEPPIRVGPDLFAAYKAMLAASCEYRARVEAAAFMARPEVRRGLEGCGEMEERDNG